MRRHDTSLVSLILTLVLIGCGCASDEGARAPETVPPPTPVVEEDTAALRASLSAAMSGHPVVRYGEAWGVLADGAELSPGAMRLFYTRRIVPVETRASGEAANEPDFWNREHVWPRSYGIDDTPAESDLHNLVPVDRTVNSSRGNKWFDEADTVHHECTLCRVSGQAWEPPPEVQGDVARILFYMDVRYEGENGVPDLSLGDAPDTVSARFGRLSTLTRWHCADPVSAEELRRHEAVVAVQGNRNAFVDSPELAEALYGFRCE